jgi:UDP-N-acetylmuramyl pentapeptide phosphotransferase/UDP-N-acetylglucosamine-1-phosphate transferase
MDFVVLLVSFSASFIFLWGLLSFGQRLLNLDVPNERSVHTNPIPRSGGLAIILGIWLGWVMLPAFPLMLFLCSFSLAILSWVDDRFRLPALLRLIFQTLVIMVFVCGRFDSLTVLSLIVLVALIWMTNLYNFMDGSDGMAGGMTIVGFGFYAVVAKAAGNELLCLLSLSISVSAIPFLVCNFHPAKVFMGDVGSIPLGFLAGALGYLGWEQKSWPLWYPPLVFSPFIADATITLIRRIVAGEMFWLAHRDHFYQRFLLMGAGHSRTFAVALFLMLASGSTATLGLLLRESAQFLILLSWIAVYAILAFIVDHRWKKNTHDII